MLELFPILFLLVVVVSAETTPSQADWNAAVDGDIREWATRDAGHASYQWLRRVTITKERQGWKATGMIDAQHWEVEGIVTNMTRSSDIRFDPKGSVMGYPQVTVSLRLRPTYKAQSWLRFADQGVGGSLTGIMGMTVNFWMELRLFQPPYPSSSGTTYIDDGLTANFDMDLTRFDATIADELKSTILNSERDNFFGAASMAVQVWLLPIIKDNMPRTVELMTKASIDLIPK